MARQQKNFKLPLATLRNLAWLQHWTELSEAEIVTMALDQMYQREVQRLEHPDRVTEALKWEAEAEEGIAAMDEAYYAQMSGDSDD